ncbi:FYVE zinc finger [Macleaya cordata]|uniref:FYVE zinc finger n=1 Tax=Macleaya cordata TaxID=56857 RepID=A0A200QV33_MACCD|nr:FYVE zinc finger [Macleaya cordata]
MVKFSCAAIVALKKGAQLLKYGRRGKPKFCPFRLSTDEKHLLWYSGQEERYLSLDSVTKIILGQGNVNFQRQPQPEKECQSFSLIYANGERSLDLICKDKEQAESWCVGLRALITRSHHSRPLGALRSHRGAQSCINSPVGYTRRKRNLGIVEDPTKFSQVRSLCGSPTRSLAERCLSDGLSYSSNSFCSSEPRIFSTKTVIPDYLIEKKRETSISTEYQMGLPSAFTSSPQGLLPVESNDVLRDVLIWGEGIEGGHLGGVVDQTCTPNSTKSDSLLPKLLESTATLDIKSISFGGKHAALVTRQGEVFCWGHEKGGRLGHRINMDVSCPKIVESLNGVDVESVACGEYHTCALTLSGELYTWGDSGVGLLDNGSNRSKWLPQKVSGPLDGIYVSSVTCGEWHTAVVSASGQLFTYGDGTFGVLGHGNLQSVSQPKQVESLKGLRVKSVACGPWHMAAVVDIMADHLKANAPGGKLFTWGDGDKGRLGHLDQERKLLPTCVARLVDHDFVQVSCGRMMTVGLTNTGIVCTMGSAAHGQLGNPQVEDKSIAIVEGKLKGEFVKYISSGSYHIAVLTSRGKVYTWGKGANGRLGLGDTEDRNSPTLVEALKERQVESVVCGSSFTAAICLHKSIFCSDQSTCSGCRMVFGFTRKKHNCYNCGFQFCRACSSKKVINASLAPNKNKLHRVCDSCYNKLTKSANTDRVIQHEKDRGEATSTQALMFSPKLSGDEETKFVEGQAFGKQGINQQLLDPVSPLSSGLPRWGQVPCPVLFSTSDRDCSSMSIDLPNNEPSAVSPAYAQIVPLGSKSLIHPAMNSGKDLSESDRIITEVQRLRAEAKSLEKKCQVKSDIIQQYQQRVEETWSLAKEEAAKCKAAKDIIKVLSAKLYTMSEKQCAGREANVISVLAEGVHLYLPQLRPICTDTSALEDAEPMRVSSQLSPIVGLPKERLLDDLCNSPIQFRNTLSSTYERAKPDGDGRSADAKTDSKQNVTKASKSEWVEQDEPGVYITFVTLPSGQKGLKRVRFSRRRFSEKEAERWWEENQIRIYQNFKDYYYIAYLNGGIDGITTWNGLGGPSLVPIERFLRAKPRRAKYRLGLNSIGMVCPGFRARATKKTWINYTWLFSGSVADIPEPQQPPAQDQGDAPGFSVNIAGLIADRASAAHFALKAPLAAVKLGFMVPPRKRQPRERGRGSRFGSFLLLDSREGQPLCLNLRGRRRSGSPATTSVDPTKALNLAAARSTSNAFPLQGPWNQVNHFCGLNAARFYSGGLMGCRTGRLGKDPQTPLMLGISSISSSRERSLITKADLRRWGSPQGASKEKIAVFAAVGDRRPHCPSCIETPWVKTTFPATGSQYSVLLSSLGGDDLRCGSGMLLGSFHFEQKRTWQ